MTFQIQVGTRRHGDEQRKEGGCHTPDNEQGCTQIYARTSRLYGEQLDADDRKVVVGPLTVNICVYYMLDRVDIMINSQRGWFSDHWELAEVP